MKKFKFVAFLLACVITFPLFACSNNSGVVIDETKTQIYIDHYNGGVGDAWFAPLKTRFEEAYKDYEIGDKKGVQLIISNHKNQGTQIIDTISSSSMDVFFSEKFYYYDGLAKDLFLDISDIVTKVNTDGKTIESKLSQTQSDFYKYNEKYYALPHYAYYGGLPYNVDVFEDNLLYFSNNSKVNGGFITSLESTRSLGPDGKTGKIDGVNYSLDDGLPATYEEFFKLCDRMIDCDVIPFTWSGEYGKAYFTSFLTRLAISYEGKEQSLLNFTFDGTAKNLIKSIDDNGVVTFEEPTTIKQDNGYRIYESAGRYYALKFGEQIFSNRDYYDFERVSNGSDSHTDAQTRFVLSNYDPAEKPIAFLIDGTYWENEADGVGAFATLKNLYRVEKQDARFGFMPMPKVDASHIGDKDVFMDGAISLAFINANVQNRCPEKIDLLKKFLQFCYTDASLREYTVETGSLKAIEYNLTDDDKQQLSYFTRSVVDFKEQSDAIPPFANSIKFVNNQETLSFGNTFSTSNYSFALSALKDGVKAKDYFNQIILNHDSDFWGRI